MGAVDLMPAVTAARLASHRKAIRPLSQPADVANVERKGFPGGDGSQAVRRKHGDEAGQRDPVAREDEDIVIRRAAKLPPWRQFKLIWSFQASDFDP